VSARVAVPDFQTLMRPVLEALADADDLSTAAIRAWVAQHFSLTRADLDETIPSGEARTFENRVEWALTYLVRAGLVEGASDSTHRLTERGRQVMAEHPDRVDMRVLSAVTRRASRP